MCNFRLLQLSLGKVTARVGFTGRQHVVSAVGEQEPEGRRDGRQIPQGVAVVEVRGEENCLVLPANGVAQQEGTVVAFGADGVHVERHINVSNWKRHRETLGACQRLAVNARVGALHLANALVVEPSWLQHLPVVVHQRVGAAKPVWAAGVKDQAPDLGTMHRMTNKMLESRKRLSVMMTCRRLSVLLVGRRRWLSWASALLNEKCQSSS